MSSRARLVCLVSAFLIVFAAALRPEARGVSDSLSAPQEMNFTLEGKISKHTPGKLTVSAGENIIFHVRYDEKTEIARPDGSTASAKDLRVGTKIRVDGDLTESGEIIALRIEIQPDREPE